MSTTSVPATRSLADALRGRDDSELEALLELRPDLVSPVPTDIAALASRATTSASIARAMDRLDRWLLQVTEVLAVLPDPTSYDVVRAAIPDAADDDVRRAVNSLRQRALLWGDDDEMRLVRGVREACGPHPAGLGPSLADHPLVGPMAYDPSLIDSRLEAAPTGARDALDRLLWGPPTGRVENARRVIRLDTAKTPVEWLLALGLLVGVDDRTVVVPREVALHLRGDRVHRTAQPEPPRPAVEVSREVETVDRTAAGSAATTIRQVEELLEEWSVSGPSVLRSGGLGVREHRALARDLDVDEPTSALLLEVCFAAGLLAPSDDADATWLPTPAYDLWKAKDPAHRWVWLADAWSSMTRVPLLVGRKDSRDKTVNALGPDLDRAAAPDIRAGVLSALADETAGAVLTSEQVTEVLDWHRPRRAGPLRDELVPATLREAELLGMSGRGALSTAGRQVLGGDGEAAAAALAPLLPEPLDHVLLQADLTAVAPGPLTAELSHELRLAADVESTGGATVYRFTESSVRRALDAGRTAEDLHATLARHSRTPVPQPLTYLIDDIARRHGRIRVGSASAYLRCDDPAVLDELVADRRSNQLRLRRLAPTVVAAQAPVDVVLDRLRESGLAPAAESSDGDILVRRPDARRTSPRQRPPRLVVDAAPPGPTLLSAAVRAIRAGERASSAPRGQTVAGPSSGGTRLPRTAAVETLAALRDAVAASRPVWIGYVDNHGSTSERVVDPVRVSGGYLTAYDHRVEEVRTFAVHRITGVAALDDDSTPATS